MKLLFAIKNLANASGGAERVLCMLCSELARRGHDITLVTFDPPGSHSFYTIDQRVKRIDLCIGHSAKSADLFETFKRMNALRHLVKAQKPDVAIGFMHSMFIPLALSLIGASVPVIGSEHIVPEHYRTRPLQFMLLLLAAPLMAKITVLSENIRKNYPSLIRSRMIAIPNPVMTATNLAVPGKKKSRYRVLNVGRLDPQKDHQTLIDAFSKIAKKFPEWDLKIIGEGLLRSKLEKQIRDLKLPDRIHLAGVSSAIEVEYTSADVFALSSSYESFGLATAEAMAHGLPVIGFADCPGTNELIHDGQTGVLVKSNENRVSSFAEGMASLMADSGRRQRLGEAAQLSMGQKFSIQSVVVLWEELLKSVYSPDSLSS